ncbi:hypothetical protein ABPG75_009526 [Micractinium tetrahymenae]
MRRPQKRLSVLLREPGAQRCCFFIEQGRCDGEDVLDEGGDEPQACLNDAAPAPAPTDSEPPFILFRVHTTSEGESSPEEDDVDWGAAACAWLPGGSGGIDSEGAGSSDSDTGGRAWLPDNDGGAVFLAPEADDSAGSASSAGIGIESALPAGPAAPAAPPPAPSELLSGNSFGEEVQALLQHLLLSSAECAHSVEGLEAAAEGTAGAVAQLRQDMEARLGGIEVKLAAVMRHLGVKEPRAPLQPTQQVAAKGPSASKPAPAAAAANAKAPTAAAAAGGAAAKGAGVTTRAATKAAAAAAATAGAAKPAAQQLARHTRAAAKA